MKIIMQKNLIENMVYIPIIITSIFSIITFLFIGCAKVSYQNEQGAKFNYIGFGKQIQGFEADIDGDRKIIKLNKSENSLGNLTETLKNLSEKIP